MSQTPLPPDQVQAVIEGILLAAEEPVTPSRLCEFLEGHSPRDVRETVDALNVHYQEHGHGMAIVQVAGGYQFCTRPDLGPWVRRFHQDRSRVRLSQAALEALAIVAFRQPITRVDIDAVRGVNSAGVLQTLMELDLIRIVGRSDGVGRPMLFGTTKEFLVHFGLNSLADLPKPRELEELLAQGERKAEGSERKAEGAPVPPAPAGPGDGEEAAATWAASQLEQAPAADPGDGDAAERGQDAAAPGRDAEPAPAIADVGDPDVELTPLEVEQVPMGVGLGDLDAETMPPDAEPAPDVESVPLDTEPALDAELTAPDAGPASLDGDLAPSDAEPAPDADPAPAPPPTAASSTSGGDREDAEQWA